ncbi:monocarboxylate transporter 10-like isoform X1 [Oculina patagonica]
MKAIQVQEHNCASGNDAGHEPKWRPDSCWSWLVCAASVMSICIVSGIGYSFGILLPPLMENFKATRQATAWIGSINLAFGYLLSPLGSYITDRFSYRFTAILGSLSGMVGFFLASLSPKLWMMYVTYGLMSGFGYRMIYNSSMLVVVDYFVKWRSLVVGIVASATAIGMFVMTQVTQALLSAFGWQGTLRGFAVLYSVCGLCAIVFVPLDKLNEEGIDSNSVKKRVRQKETRNLSLFRNRPFLVMLSSFFVVNISYFVPAVHIIKHCEQELHIPGDKASMLYTYLGIASFFSRHLFCKLGDLKYFNRFHLYQGAMTINGLCVVCLPFARSFGSVVAVIVVFGLMDGAMMGQFSLLVLKCVSKDKLNQAWGYIMLFIGLSICIGPPMAGLMTDKFGSYTVTFYTAGAILIAGASITTLMAFVKQQPEKAGETEYYEEELLVIEKITVV